MRRRTPIEPKQAPSPALPLSRSPALALSAILLAYLGLAFGYALVTPRWNNPDEPAHYTYLATLARTGRFPILQPGDWDSQQLGERLASGRFTTAEPIEAFRYEGHQPPLYYVLTAPIFKATERLGLRAQVVALRSASILFGLLTILTVYAAARTLAPTRPELPPLAAGIVAFIPMHTAMTATINNDTLAELLASATLLALVRGLQRGFGLRAAVVLGTLCGALLVTKFTVYIFVPLALLALAGPVWASLKPPTPPLPRSPSPALPLGLAALIALAPAAWWWARDVAVYGWPDLFGLIRHDQVVVGQPRWPGLGENLESVRFFGYSLFRSFWAQFGWMAVVLDGRFYWLFLLLMLLATGGLVRFWRVERPDWPVATVRGLGVLLAALGLVVLEVVVYNLSFIQAQGRYLYPAILPIGILLALGWSTLAAIGPSASPVHRLGFGLGVFWLWASLLEALSWLIAGGPAPPLLHLSSAVSAWFATRVPVRRATPVLRRGAAAALVVALALVDAAALTRFVAPYFVGW